VGKKVFLLTIFALLLSACGQAPPLWGAYQTPTAEIYVPRNAVQAAIPTITATTTVVLPTVTPPSTATPTTPPTETPESKLSALGTPELSAVDGPTRFYYSQSGDTLEVVALHFGVEVEEINANEELPETNALLDPGTLLIVPDRLEETTPDTQIFPDSEIVLSATTIDGHRSELF